ncbi:MAG: hypothetical protein Kow0037_04580 [Calditrichia bacterium]
MFYVYVLLSEKDGKFYIGQTNNLEKRLSRHFNGYVKSTRHRRPLKLLFFEEHSNRNLAMNREEFLKSGLGHQFIKSKLKELADLER